MKRDICYGFHSLVLSIFGDRRVISIIRRQTRLGFHSLPSLIAVGSSRRWQDSAPFMSVRIVLLEKVDLSRGEASMGFPIEGTEAGNSTPIMGLPLNATEVSSSHTTTFI